MATQHAAEMLMIRQRSSLWRGHVAIGQQELVAWSDCYPLHAIELQRSLTYQGGSHARRVIKRLASGNSMNIVVIGGSTALGVGARLGFGESLAPLLPSSLPIFANAVSSFASQLSKHGHRRNHFAAARIGFGTRAR